MSKTKPSPKTVPVEADLGQTVFAHFLFQILNNQGVEHHSEG